MASKTLNWNELIAQSAVFQLVRKGVKSMLWHLLLLIWVGLAIIVSIVIISAVMLGSSSWSIVGRENSRENRLTPFDNLNGIAAIGFKGV